MKNSVFSKMVSVFMCLTMLFAYVVMLPSEAYAQSTADIETVRGVAVLGSNTGTEGADWFRFSDDMFRHDSAEYDPDLALTSIELAAAARMSIREPDTEEGYANKVRNLRSFLEDNGFSDFEASNEYSMYSPGESGAALACAHKKITADGRTYTLLTLMPRTGTFGGEFEYVFRLSRNAEDSGDNYEFTVRKDAILDFAKDYISSNGISGDIKVWTVGYSRSAGIVNLLGASLIDEPERLGEDISLSPEDVYCYTFGTPLVASGNKDYSGEKYRYIHNIVAKNDLIPLAPPAEMGFHRYGTDHQITSEEHKERMLSLLKEASEAEYEDYISSDPEDYTALKLDTKALLGGELSFIPDEDSYLPSTIREYNASLCRTVTDMMARYSKSGKNSREGYYREFQEPLLHAGNYLISPIFGGDGGIEIDDLKDDKRIIPFALTMYLSFMADKDLVDGNAKINGQIEGAFNALAAFAENEDGTLREEYGPMSAMYYKMRDMNFELREDPESVDGILQKYELRYDAGALTRSRSLRKKTADLLKKMNARLYAAILGDILRQNGADGSAIKVMTSDEDSEAMSFLFAALLFGNSLQSKDLRPFSLGNEQFKQLATFAGNVSRLTLEHNSVPCTAWVKADDPFYDDEVLTDAQKAGYRRVYLSGTGRAHISGTVKDENGSTVAGFRDGKLVSRTDKWIGITTCDSGNWLRLPVSGSYSVEITADGNTDISVKVADFSVEEGAVIRTVTGDEGGDWSGIRTTASDRLTLSVPAVSASADGSYDLTSAVYKLRLTKGEAPDTDRSEIVSRTVPAAKKVKLSAGKKSFTVRWTKLSPAKRAGVDKIEVQYSTSRKFRPSATVSKKLAKSRKSLKVKGLKKRKVYYVRVRTIKYGSDAVYVSKWSKVRKIRTRA